jgi:hypothetical protein
MMLTGKKNRGLAMDGPNRSYRSEQKWLALNRSRSLPDGELGLLPPEVLPDETLGLLLPDETLGLLLPMDGELDLLGALTLGALTLGVEAE